DIIFGATNKDLCKSFEKLMKDKLQMSSIGELTFFMRLQVKQKKDGIFISQDKYVAEILKKFGLTEGKSASTPIDTEKPLLKDTDGEDVDLHIYSKSDTSEGFNQIINFLNGSYIEYALTVNLTIYVSCIKQFWNAVAVKQSNNVTRLQALVDKKKVVVTEATIRDTLHLDDAEGVDCLPNEEIFTELARMGYEKPSTKLTFYKAFFSSQWKFLIHTILKSMSAKRTSWKEFSSTMASDVICLSTGRKFNFSKYIFDSLVRNVDSSSKFYMYPRRVGKGCSGVETQLFEGMLVAREPEEHGDAEEQGNDDNATEEPVTTVSEDDEALDTCAALTRRVKHLEHDKVAQNLEITKLKTRVKKLERANKVKALKLRRMRKAETSQRVDTSDDTIMEDVSNQGRMIDELDKDEGAVLINEKEGTEEVKDITGDAQVERRQTKIYQIDMDHAAKVLINVAAVVPAATVTPAPVKSKDKGKGIMVEESILMKRKQQVELDEAYARKLHEELNQDIDWEVPIDHVKQKAKENPYVASDRSSSSKKYDNVSKEYYWIQIGLFQGNIEEEENRVIESINETPTQKEAKRRRLNEEAEDVKELKQHLEIVPDEDDVYTEATPLARKLIMLVERRYPLLRFTLDQMLNTVRLRVEEQSEMSLELIRFLRQQLHEGQHN
nr:ribonuclease H-like domain-containing protein [Tanacetum cinerariifolium]